MEIPEKIVMTEKLCATIRSNVRETGVGKRSWYEADIYLLGRDKKGDYVDGVRLHKHHTGCYVMPKVESNIVLRAYMELAQKKLTPGGFAISLMPGNVRTDDRAVYDLLGAPAQYPGHLFVLFMPEPSAFIYTKERETKWIPVEKQ